MAGIMSEATATITAPARTTTPEALEQRFGISSATWRRWVNLGRLTGYRLGRRRLLLDLAEVEALVIKGKVAAPAEVA